MMRLISAIILIGISLAVFLLLTSPIYSEIAELREQSSSYDEALFNSKALENERDKLTAKYNSINPENLVKLRKLLPENIDNIRLILEIEQIAAPYGMALRNVKYGTTDYTAKASSAPGITGGITPEVSSRKDYGVWDLEFSATGTYSNFLNFIRDLQSNLRIVDISSIQFSSSNVAVQPGSSPDPSAEVYRYDFKIKTYWLKN